jgi:hypothetical protein
MILSSDGSKSLGRSLLCVGEPSNDQCITVAFGLLSFGGEHTVNDIRTPNIAGMRVATICFMIVSFVLLFARINPSRNAPYGAKASR